MNRTEHLLVIVGEEATEISIEAPALRLAQRAAKALRFGLAERQPAIDGVQDSHPDTNADRIMHEFADLCGVVETMQAEGLLPPVDRKRIDAKRAKIEQYLAYSAAMGTVSIAVESTPGIRTHATRQMAEVVNAGAVKAINDAASKPVPDFKGAVYAGPPQFRPHAEVSLMNAPTGMIETELARRAAVAPDRNETPGGDMYEQFLQWTPDARECRRMMLREPDTGASESVVARRDRERRALYNVMLALGEIPWGGAF